MKSVVLMAASLSVFALSACSQPQAPQTSSSAAPSIATASVETADKTGVKTDTKTKAVLIYADWCGSCKVLDPKIKDVQAKGDRPGLEYVTLDFTNKNITDFYAQADAAGVGLAVRDHMDGTVKTGQLLLIDFADQIVISKVTKTFEPAEISTAIDAALAAS